MTDDKVGYKNPPKRTRFKPGVCPNTKGRGKRETNQIVEAVERFRGTKVAYQEGGKLKRAVPDELSVKLLIARALEGDPRAAERLISLRTYALSIEPDVIEIIVHGGLPEDSKHNRKA